jgi:hypothetical protein
MGSSSFSFFRQRVEAYRRLFQGRKRLSYNGLIVVEEAASKWHQSHREDRQDGDHTHYKPPLRKTTPAKKHVSGHDWWRNCNSKRMTLGKLDDPSELACLLAGDCPGSREKFVPIKRSIWVIVPQIMRCANAWRIIQLAMCDLVVGAW